MIDYRITFKIFTTQSGKEVSDDRWFWQKANNQSEAIRLVEARAKELYQTTKLELIKVEIMSNEEKEAN